METPQTALLLIITAGLLVALIRKLKNSTVDRLTLKPILVRIKMVILFTGLSIGVFAQNYTSNGNGTWTTNGNWQGGSAPTMAGQNWGYVRVNHNLTINGNYDYQASSWVSGVQIGLEIAATKTLQINGNFSISNGAIVNVYGTLNITGDLSITAPFNIYPGGKVVVDGNVTVSQSTYLKIGTNVAPGSYADFVVKKSLMSKNGGDITVERNARVAIFKDFTTDTGGGTFMDIKSGGQVYIDGKIDLAGGNDAVTNANGTTPIGFYVNGAITTNSGNGAAVSANRGTKATMFTNDKPFYDWVVLQNGVLPIKLLSFKVDATEAGVILLSWATAMEENFDKFIVERSADGINYSSIVEIKGAGNSKVLQRYSYRDSSPLIGASYYRLKSIDFDLSFDYSNVVYATYSGDKKLNIYPNPSRGESIQYSLNFDPQEDDKIAVIDFSGSIVTTAFVNQVNGEIVFDTPLKRGTYILKYTSGHFQKVERLVVN